MYSCNSQSFILEHFLRIDTSRPESWLSALQILTTSPRLSRKLLPPSGSNEFRARLSCMQSKDLNVLGGYLRNASIMSGVNAGSAVIIMPVEGRVDIELTDDHSLCGPWTPFILEPNEEFHATLSEDAHLLIIQLPRLKGSGYRPAFLCHQPMLTELLTAFLYETPFYRDYEHAERRVEYFATHLYSFTGPDYSPSSEFDIPKKIRDDRRLCTAIQVLNNEINTDIDIKDVARRSGLSLRSLHYLMRQFIGQSPYQYLRSRRLVKAREAIIRGYPKNTSVAQHAADWGFQHAGRFSAYYKHHFGEYPTQTLSELEYLKQMTDSVKSVKDDSGNISHYWLTSAAQAVEKNIKTSPVSSKQES